MAMQYIGARYVPKFYENGSGTSAWTANTQYEPLTIVTRNGNSYTSKKLVPANIGAPESNPSYWVSTGIYNDQIETLVNDVSDLQSDVSDLQTDMGSLSRYVNPRRFIFVSDSYGLRSDTNGTNILDKLATVLNAYSYNKVAKNGIGFTNVNSAGTFLEELQNATITQDADDVTDILVIGGANDYGGNQAAIESAISSFVSYCKTTYPNAEVYIAHVGCSRNNRTAVNLRCTCSILAYRRCPLYGAKYLNNTEYALHHSGLLEVDGVHPTANGVDRIISYVAEAYESGQANVHYDDTLTATFNESQTTYTAASIGTTQFAIVHIDNDVTELVFNGGNVLELTLSGSTVASGLVKIFDFNYRLIIGDSSAGYAIVCDAYGLTSGGTKKGRFPVIMYIDDTGGLSIFCKHEFIDDNTGIAKIKVLLSGSAAFPTINC